MKAFRKKIINNRPMEKRSINDPNEINTGIEIPMYAPNLGLSPKEYQISPQLNDFELKFEEKCREFLSQANPDEFNASYMDAVIERICIDAISFIKVQREDHVQLITNMLNIMRNGDFVRASNKLETFINDKDKNEKELDKYRHILWSGTSLEEEE